jgi:hypothetical protein
VIRKVSAFTADTFDEHGVGEGGRLPPKMSHKVSTIPNGSNQRRHDGVDSDAAPVGLGPGRPPRLLRSDTLHRTSIS